MTFGPSCAYSWSSLKVVTRNELWSILKTGSLKYVKLNLSRYLFICQSLSRTKSIKMASIDWNLILLMMARILLIKEWYIQYLCSESKWCFIWSIPFSLINIYYAYFSGMISAFRILKFSMYSSAMLGKIESYILIFYHNGSTVKALVFLFLFLTWCRISCSYTSHYKGKFFLFSH